VSALFARLMALEQRERRFLLAGAAAVALALLLGLISLDHSVSRAQAHLSAREQDLAWMRSVAAELAAAGPASQSAPATQGSLIVIVDQAAHEAGLGTALMSSEPSGSGGLRVRLDKAPFDILVGWLERLSQQHAIRVSSATINEAGAPGLVDATLVLEAAH
jgi:general secretion pathway protein M